MPFDEGDGQAFETNPPLWVPGNPRPKGSISMGAKAYFDKGKQKWRAKPFIIEDKKLTAWEKAIAGAAFNWWPHSRLQGPVRVVLQFIFQRPGYHYRSGKFSHLLKDSYIGAPHVTYPDGDKCSRAVHDALTGVVYMDDKQVISSDWTKAYAAAHMGSGVRIYLIGCIDGKKIGHLPEAQDA